MLLKDIVAERTSAAAEAVKLREEFNAAIARIEARIARLNEAENLVMVGLDFARIERARKLVYVNGKVTQPNAGFDGRGDGSGARARLVEQAKEQIVLGGGRLRTEYFGIKNYEAFGDQREDHRYGYGPRHGSTVFSVGLVDEVRSREDICPLRAEEIEDALYFLTALPTIEKAAQKDRAA